ncbi:uncharacterized protein LOC134883765 [Eleginops maclovinus]|uniref:uncharacterized protein LOC134864960 n=1 Tax=Eleginops maclovinus TaxID=56733 RepID=UPI00308052A2
MGKCRFNPSWVHDAKYNWVQPVPGNVWEAQCTLCRKTFKLGTMGHIALNSHMKSAKHTKLVEVRSSQAPIATFCVPPSVQSTSVASATPLQQVPLSGLLCGSTPTLQAEVIWTLRTVYEHHSYSSNEGITDVFKCMFPDSQIAATFSCGSNKTAYLTKFGLVPFISKELTEQVNQAVGFVPMLDESLNKSTKTKQLDIHLRYWDGDRVRSRYFGSQFMGHAKAVDLLSNFKECLRDLDLRRMVSLSMDGPNVNWRFLEMLQTEHAEHFGGAQLVVVGSCGLHTLHNAVKCGFTEWHMEKFLRALHTIFHNVPARREDFCNLTKSKTFALPFCGHRWIENLPVVQRAIEIWPDMKKYVDAVTTKKLPNPGTSSYDTIEVATKDPLILAKLHFFMAVSRSVTPFLTKYQTDEPVLPFFANDLAELLKNLLRRFIKRELLTDVTPQHLVRLDVTDKQSRVHPKAVDIGIGAETAIKELQQRSKSSEELSILHFQNQCMECLSKMVQKIQERSPLKFPIVRQLTCLNPAFMYSNPELCQKQMKSIVRKFLQDRQLDGGVAAGDLITQKFSEMLSVEVRTEEFQSFQPFKKRLDVFLSNIISETYPQLWSFIQKLLLLSHGQATVERGFSVNKEIETANIHEDTVVAQRIVCDYISLHGGVTKVPLTPALLSSVSSSRARYRIHLETERKKRESQAESEKRKAIEENLEQLRKHRRSIKEVAEHLLRDADKLADQAEAKQAGSKMAELIAKSNAFRRSHKEKMAELIKLDEQIAAKRAELQKL